MQRKLDTDIEVNQKLCQTDMFTIDLNHSVICNSPTLSQFTEDNHFRNHTHNLDYRSFTARSSVGLEQRSSKP